MMFDDLPDDGGRWFLLSASVDGLEALGEPPAGVPLRAAVNRELMSSWWPIPGSSSQGLAKVPQGALGLVYVGTPVSQTIARVVLDAGPVASEDPRARFGYRLLAVDPLVPAAPYPKERPHQSRGIERLSREQFEDALAAVYGSKPWRPESIPSSLDPVIYRRVRFVHTTESTWLRWQLDAAWPTIDRDGRVRFGRWPGPPDHEARPATRGWAQKLAMETRADDPHLPFTAAASEIVRADWVDAGDLPEDHERERIFAVDSSGRETEVTDAAIEQSLSSYEAGIAGVLTDEEAELVAAAKGAGPPIRARNGAARP